MPQLRISLSADNLITHELTEEKITIGRLADNAIQIEDGSVSSHHAELVQEGSGYKLVDLNSTNGTFVNGHQVTEHVLHDGDLVRFGQIDAVYGVHAAEKGEGAQPLPSAGGAQASLGSSSARPASFVNASPFPKPKEKADPLSVAAMVIAAIAALGFLAASIMSLTLQAPV